MQATACRIACLLSLLLAVTACQPSYTVDQSEHYARQLGLIDRFSIERWHHRVLPASSRLSFVVEPVEGVDSQQVLSVAQKAFTPFFAAVSTAGAVQGRVAALRKLSPGSTDFLFYISYQGLEYRKANSSADAFSHDEPADEGSDAQSKTLGFAGATLIISVVDVNSGIVIDRIRVQGQQSYPTLLFDAELEDVLSTPLQRVAQDLSRS